MTELLTAAQMRAIEQAAIDSGEVTGLELMERAGQGVVDAILEWRPELAEKPHRAVVLCGPGNNGGDGFVVARLLHDRGWNVEVFLYGRAPDDLDKLPPDAATNAQRWAEIGPIRQSTSFSGWECRVDVCIEALFGTGLSRPLSGEARRITECITSNGVAPTVSIDLPAGICADSGRALGATTVPDVEGADCSLTVTFHALKIGHVLGEAPTYHCGEIKLAKIGLSEPTAVATVRLVKPGSSFHGGSLAKDEDHKYDHGHALVLSGGVGKGGAARLTARGALRIGAGLVTVGCPPAALIENAARLDAIMLRPIADADALRDTLTDPRIKALCLGPGLGVGPRTRALVEAACADERSEEARASATTPKRGVVLDADALTSFEKDPAELFAKLHTRCVLTPHEGEFGRLFPDILAKLKEPAVRGPAYSKVDATREAAERAGCVVLFKGADTVIADPSGRASINSAHYERAAPWLATAGSGDVLAGMITGLLARGLPPMAAAETAAWLHVECALTFGPGLIAEDLPEQLPTVFRKLGL